MGIYYHHLCPLKAALTQSILNTTQYHIFNIYLHKASRLWQTQSRQTQVRHRCQLSVIQINHLGLFFSSCCCSRLVRILVKGLTMPEAAVKRSDNGNSAGEDTYKQPHGNTNNRDTRLERCCDSIGGTCLLLR